MQKGTDWNISKQSGRPEYQGLFLSPANRLVSTDRELPTNLVQSCKPAAVGMLAYSGSVNICFYRMCPYSPEDNFKQLFWPIINMHVQQNTVYSCKKSTPGYEGEGGLWSTFRVGLITTFSKAKKNK